MTDLSISPIEAFTDNYIWCLCAGEATVVVDPGDAAPVKAHLLKNNLQLTAILITHHHPDHVGGVAQLLEDFPTAVVYGPAKACPQITHPVQNGDTVTLGGLPFSVLAVPGHTLDHIAYFSAADTTAPILFCGDTLFAGGCGRIFEGTAPQMWASLKTLSQLPANTAVYCAHEYTLANLRFALLAEPGNVALQSRFQEAQLQRDKGQPTVPSTLALELATNPFLRADSPELQQQVAAHTGIAANEEVQVFAELREWKNNN
jgi:hydroxyacylglutathione hydrolase